MTAEDKLKEWYKEHRWRRQSGCGGKEIIPEHIDLIADLVVERMKNDITKRRQS